MNNINNKTNNKTRLKPLLRLLPFVRPYKGKVICALIALLLASAATLAVPLAVRQMIDHGFGAENAAFIDKYFLLMVLVALILALASAARFYFVTWIGERVVADIRSAVFSHLTNLSAHFFEVTHTGEILSRLTADTTQIKAAFGASVSIALRNLVLFVGAVIMMVVTSTKLSGLVLLAIPFIVLPLVIFGRWVRRLSRKAQDSLADTSIRAGESLGAIGTVQAYGLEEHEQNAFAKSVEQAFDMARLRTRARAFLTACIIFIALGSVVVILWWGARDVLEGSLSGGQLGQFVLYAAFAAGALGELSQVWGELQLALGSSERLTELLSTGSEITDPKKPQAFTSKTTGSIIFKNVEFTYPTRPEVKVLQDVSFEVKPGETVAIVGPSGAGKSTLFSLLLRFYDRDKGTIKIDGVDVKKTSLQDLRARMALVPQDPVIFSSTARENIACGKRGASEDDIIVAAKAAQADGFIQDLPDKYDTTFGERGTTLSGGQKQRLAVARALLRDAPILLLDEATSALDSESETSFQSALESLKKGRTTLVIAHKLSTVIDADRILVMDEGKIIASGTHKQLLKKGGLYKRLAELQFVQSK